MPDSIQPVEASKPITMHKADGWVVVLRWTPARSRHTAMTYECYAKLENAVAKYRDPGSSFEAHGIFPALDGLPSGPALDVKTILSVMPGEKNRPGLREFDPTSAESAFLRDQHRFMWSQQ